MAIRPANSVSILQKRLKQAESAEIVDAMELIGIHDELSRIERKWIIQVNAGSDRRRPATDAEKLTGWYQRLSMLIRRAMRSESIDPMELAALKRIASLIDSRASFPSG